MKIFRPLWRDGLFWSRSSFSNRPAGTRTSPIRSPHGARPPVGYCARSLTRARSPFPAQRHPADRAFRRRSAD